MGLVRRHPHYIREEEPFEFFMLRGEIEFRQNCNRLHNGIQMYYNASRVKTYGFMSECVIFDRSPVDYIAYSQYTADYATTDVDNALRRDGPEGETNAGKLVEMEDDGIRSIDLPYRSQVVTS